MNKNYTLKELADIGAKAGHSWERDWSISTNEAFTKAILDAIGYEFPKDEEREAFENWLKYNPCWDKRDEGVAFFAWKAGREELRRAQMMAKEPGDTKTEPAWIPWEGGECPLGDGVEFELKFRGGHLSGRCFRATWHSWRHDNVSQDIVAYRVLER